MADISAKVHEEKKIFVIILCLLLEHRKTYIYITNSHTLQIKQTVLYFSGAVFSNNIQEIEWTNIK